MKKHYIIWLIHGLPNLLVAQNKMLIEQIEGKIITRKSFTKNGALIDKQTFQVGKINKISNYLEIKMLTKTYDEKGKLVEQFKTNYKCKPEDSNLLLMIIPFSKPKSDKKTMVLVNSGNFKELYNLDSLKDIDIELRFESGLLESLGSKSSIRIYDRQVEKKGKEKILHSKLSLKAYALGIRLKNLKYDVTEKLTETEYLYFQNFKGKDGEYFTVSYKNIQQAQ